MSWQLVAALDAGAARDAAPVDPDVFLPDGYSGSDNPLGSNSWDSVRQAWRLPEYGYQTGCVRVGETGDWRKDFVFAVSANLPPEGYRWVRDWAGQPRVYRIGQDLPEDWAEIKVLWVDGVRVR